MAHQQGRRRLGEDLIGVGCGQAALAGHGAATSIAIERLFVMRRLLLQVMAGVIGLLALSGQAPRQKPPDVVGAGTVTILTDGIAEPSGRATRAVNELAERPARIGNIRVLPIAGHGAAANVRDLLYLRGVDLAILNSDILEFLDQTRQYPDARQRIRYVTHLFDQKVYLLARKEFSTIEDLRGRKLAVLSEGGGSHTTAATLFGLTKIDVVLEPLGPDAVGRRRLGKFDGALLLSDELARVRLSSQCSDWRVLPIALTPALGKAYRPAVIEAGGLPALPHAAKVETLRCPRSRRVQLGPHRREFATSPSASFMLASSPPSQGCASRASV